MTSPLRRKRRITPPSTRRPSRSDRVARWLLCSLLALVLVCAAPEPSQAGKRRREGSLQRLRDRNPSERWRLLQKMWRPLADDEDSQSQPATAPQAPPQLVTDDDSAGASDADGEDSTEQDGTSPFFAPPVSSSPPVASSPPEEIGPAPDLPGSASEADPVWVIDAADEDQAPEVKRTAPSTVAANLQEEEMPRGRIDDPPVWDQAVRPKPITEIQPFEDYIPQETVEALRKRRGDIDVREELCMDQGDGTNCPVLLPLPDEEFEERAFAETYVAWEPSNLFANPLYFQDAGLERYGHTHGCLQPLLSVGKFGTQLVGLPYQMALHPVHERRYALGWYRPGECAPKKYYLPPWNTKAAITAGAAYTGLIFLIP